MCLVIVLVFLGRLTRLHRGGGRSVGRAQDASPGKLLGRVIRHASRFLPSAVGSLSVTMIEPPLGALAMPAVCPAQARPTGSSAARGSAVQPTAVARSADPEGASTKTTANIGENDHAPQAQAPFSWPNRPSYARVTPSRARGDTEGQ